MASQFNQYPVNAGAIFIAKIASEIEGEVVVTFAYADRLSLRVTHKGHTTRHHITHDKIQTDPEAAALEVLTS